MIRLVLAALLMRVAGAALRTGGGWPLRAVGWGLAAVASWAAVGAVGLWAPVWPAAPAVLGSLFERAGAEDERGSPALRAAVDAAVLAVLSFLSVPHPAWPTILAVVVGVTAAWALVDALVGRAVSGRPLARWAAVVPAALALAYGVRQAVPALREAGRLESDRSVAAWARDVLPSLGVSRPCGGRRIPLGNGTVGWLDLPPGGPPSSGAVLFHGNDDAGSAQPAACALRRALLHAGRAVVSVDHPGYGGSALPGPDAPVEAWDPLPSARAALDTLRARVGEGALWAVGHSMGTADVFRMLAAEPGLSGGVVMGGSASGPGLEDWLYDRFHRKRGMTWRMPRRSWREVWYRVYDKDRQARALPPGHPPVLFVEFGREHADIAANRDALFRLITGPAERWRLTGSTHYLNAAQGMPVLLADTEVARRVATRLRAFADRATASAAAARRRASPSAGRPAVPERRAGTGTSAGRAGTSTSAGRSRAPSP